MHRVIIKFWVPDGIRPELKILFSDKIGYLIRYENNRLKKLNKLHKDIQKNISDANKMEKELKGFQSSMVAILGIFVALFTMINVNFEFAKNLFKSTDTFIKSLIKMCTINLIMIVSIGFILLFIKLFVNNKKIIRKFIC